MGKIYFDEINRHLGHAKTSEILIDRMPFNLVETGLIHRVFPQAKFIFAQRHPCDCILSCFMQRFIPNETNVNFFTLEKATNLYNKTMILWQQYQELLPIKVYTVRYENLIVDFEQTIKQLLIFLGLGWDDSLYNFTEIAKNRKKIKTASYNQVTQPLYTSSIGRWEGYKDYLDPSLPILLPWVKMYGYDGEG